jgi:hypothetical protein
MRVVIVGGGFAVKFAKTLRNKLRGSECEILLFIHFSPVDYSNRVASSRSRNAQIPLNEVPVRLCNRQSPVQVRASAPEFPESPRFNRVPVHPRSSGEFLEGGILGLPG